MSLWLFSGIAFVIGLALLTAGTASAATVGLLSLSLALVGAASQTGRWLGKAGNSGRETKR